MCLSYNIPKDILSKAIRCYETYGVVTQRTTELARSPFRKLLTEMENAGCNDIEEAIEMEVVIGSHEEYFEVIYNSSLFSDTDEVKNYILKCDL